MRLFYIPAAELLTSVGLLNGPRMSIAYCTYLYTTDITSCKYAEYRLVFMLGIITIRGSLDMSNGE
jgi:hypothetical protein